MYVFTGKGQEWDKLCLDYLVCFKSTAVTATVIQLRLLNQTTAFVTNSKNKKTSSIQSLLPPQTPFIRDIVHHCPDTRQTQVLHRGTRPVCRESWQARRVGIVRHGEIGEILLHDDGQRVVLDQRTRPVVGCIIDVVAVKAWWDTEYVIEHSVVVCAGQIVCAAREKCLGDQQITSSCERGVASLAGRTVEHGRIERLGDVFDGRIGYRGEVRAEGGFEGGLILGKGIHELETFLDVVTGHDLEGFVQPFVEKELAG